MANEQARVGLGTLAPEIRERIFSFVVAKKDLSSIRLSCRAFVADVTQFLFAEVRLAPRYTSMRNLMRISGIPNFARHVQSFELCFDCTPRWLLSSNRQRLLGHPGWFEVWDNTNGHGRFIRVSQAEWRARVKDEAAFQRQCHLLMRTNLPRSLKNFHRLSTVRLAGPTQFLTEMLKQCDLVAEPHLTRDFEDLVFSMSGEMYVTLLRALVYNRTALEEVQIMDSFLMISRLLEHIDFQGAWKNTVSICASAKRLRLSSVLNPWKLVPLELRPPSPFPLWFLDVPPVLRENNALQELTLILNENWWMERSLPRRIQDLKHLCGPVDDDEQTKARGPSVLATSELGGKPNFAAFDSLMTLELRGVGITFAGFSDVLSRMSSRLTRLAMCHVYLEGGCWVSAIKLLRQRLALKHVFLHGLKSKTGTWYGHGVSSSPMSWQPSVACVSPGGRSDREQGHPLGQRLMEFILHGLPCPLSSLAEDGNAEREWHEQSDGSFWYTQASMLDR